MSSDYGEMAKRVRDHHDETAAELTEERSAHHTTQLRMIAADRRAVLAEAALGKANDALFEANRQLDEAKETISDLRRAALRWGNALDRVNRVLRAVAPSPSDPGMAVWMEEKR